MLASRLLRRSRGELYEVTAGSGGSGGPAKGAFTGKDRETPEKRLKS